MSSPESTIAPGPVEPLSYADEIEQFGVTVQRAPYGLRIVVPPLPSWRHLPRGYFIAISILGLLASFPLAEAIGSGGWDRSLVIPILEFGIPALLVAVYAWQLLKRRTVIDVTRNELAISFVAPTGRAGRMSWPRADLLEVRASDVNGKLIVRCRGTDTSEVYLGPSRAVVHSVAAAISEAVTADLAPASAGWFPPVWKPSPAPKVATGFLVASLIAALLAVVVLPFNRGRALVLVLVFVALLVPYAGITYGTQDKEFFT